MSRSRLLTFSVAAVVGALLAGPRTARAFYYRTFQWPMSFVDDSYISRGYINAGWIAFEDPYAVSKGNNVGFRVCLKSNATTYGGSCPAWRGCPVGC